LAKIAFSPFAGAEKAQQKTRSNKHDACRKPGSFYKSKGLDVHWLREATPRDAEVALLEAAVDVFTNGEV